MVGALMLDHFSRSELACPTTDQVRLAAGFGEALERLRVELDAPIYLNSACRSPEHNAKVRGHPRSLHLIVNDHWGTGGTCAVDVVATDGQYRAKLIALALDQDWSVGVASNFVHLDRRSRQQAQNEYIKTKAGWGTEIGWVQELRSTEAASTDRLRKLGRSFIRLN